jgi:flagellar biosynthesis/type III secretory pathway chaperone
MIAEDRQLREFAEDMIALLDEETRLLEQRAEQFDLLYDAILHRREEGMEGLLVEMTDTQIAQARLDEQLAELRGVLTEAMDLPDGKMKLQNLAERVDADQGERLMRRRERIIQLAEKLKRRHLDTALLLSESARINRMLLEGLLPGNEAPVTTYGRGGKDGWKGRSGLVDTEM